MKALFFIIAILPSICSADLRVMPMDGNNRVVLTTKPCTAKTIGMAFPGGGFIVQPPKTYTGYFIADGVQNQVCWHKEKNQVVLEFRTGQLLDYKAEKFHGIGDQAYERKYGNIIKEK